MKRLLFAALLFIPVSAFCGDDLLPRPDIYGPAATQWNYVYLTSTAAVKTSPGVLHCVTISSAATSAAAAGFTIVDSSDTSTIPNVIMAFPANAAAGGSYCPDAITAEGISVMIPANGPKLNITYR